MSHNDFFNDLIEKVDRDYKMLISCGKSINFYINPKMQYLGVK